RTLRCVYEKILTKMPYLQPPTLSHFSPILNPRSARGPAAAPLLTSCLAAARTSWRLPPPLRPCPCPVGKGHMSTKCRRLLAHAKFLSVPACVRSSRAV